MRRPGDDGWGTSLMAAESAARKFGRVRREGVTRRGPAVTGQACELQGCGSSAGSWKAWLSRQPRVGRARLCRCEAVCRFGKPRGRVTLCTAPNVVMAFALRAVVGRRGVEPRRKLRVLDVQREGVRLGEPLDGEGDGHASPSYGDDEAGPGRFQFLVRSDEAEQPCGRHEDLAGPGEAAWRLSRARAEGLKGRPTASATAMPCASMPTAPSVMIQVLAALACLLLAMRAAASSGAGVFARGLEAVFPGPLKFLERLVLIFSFDSFGWRT